MTLDAVILGGGVAGLWTLNALRNAGYHAVLLEKGWLGGGQTILSQGVLHGGLKYALNGRLNDASEAIRPMPGRWQACLEGHGDLDLRQVRVLSPKQYLFTEGRLGSRITAFFASRSLAGRSTALKREDWPEPFRNPAYTGSVYELAETVIDPRSLVKTLAGLADGRALYGSGIALQWSESSGPVQIRAAGGAELDARCAILCAGEGNAELLASLGLNTEAPTQTRPLHQAVLSAPHLPPLYGVCIGTGSKPPLVVTTHTGRSGNPVWYLGGELAEAGVHRSTDEQIVEAARLLRRVFPHLDTEKAEWSAVRAVRAEPRQPGGARPTGPVAIPLAGGRVIAAWPSKLVFTPLLADKILALLPPPQPVSAAQTRFAPPPGLHHAMPATAPWEKAA